MSAANSFVTLIAVVAIVLTCSAHSQAGGCHSHGRGGFSVHVHRPSHNHHYQPKYPQPVYRQPAYVSAPPRNPLPPQSFSQPNAPIGQPQQSIQQQPQSQPGFAQQQQQAPQRQTAAKPQIAAPISAETSALEALGGFAPPQSESTSTPVADNTELPAHVGRWSASLTNGARIQLDLNANGSFQWSAVNKEGASSSFQGTYEVANGSLTLIRSTDNQRLAGSLATNGADAFSFQLADQKAAKLEFVRA